MKIAQSARPRDPGFARKSDGRSRHYPRQVARRGAQPCRRVRRQVNVRRWSSATATRRRYGGKGVRKAVANVNGEIAECD